MLTSNIPQPYKTHTHTRIDNYDISGRLSIEYSRKGITHSAINTFQLNNATLRRKGYKYT